MNDERVSLYRQAVEALRRGQFDVDIPVGAPDAISDLGTALRGLIETLRKDREQSATLANVTKSVNEGLVIDEVLDHVYENFFSLIPYHRIGLALIEQDRETVRAFWARSEVSDIRLPVGYSAGLAGSSLESIIRTGRPRILNDLVGYLENNPKSDSTRRIVEEGIRSSLTCPLMVKGEPVGFIFFSSTERNAYREEHQEIFLKIADQLALALEKGRIYKDLLDTTAALRKARDALETEATRDSLTGLWNRRSILELLRRELARAEREQQPLSAIMIDIDHFKQINDRVGHPAGDEVLREVTGRVTSALRTADILGRIGGEEFLIILCPGDEQTAFDVMERARRACELEPFRIDSGELDVTISLGAAVVEECEDIDYSEILKTADHALYRAKEGGRNRSEAEKM
ncbi:MAG: sensor domain-containing diguanylate cyclase [Acidobacteria bacterium]|nr:sensor domain-containing diguanylate cyclase [Acidobacteriota bacterium]